MNSSLASHRCIRFTYLFAFLLLVLTGIVPRASAQSTEPVNLNFEQGAAGGIPSGWTTGMGAVRDDTETNPTYAVTVTTRKARVNRYCACLFSKAKPEAGQFGNLMQTIDATPYRNKRVRFRAFICLERSNPKSIGGTKLWLHVDRSNKTTGILDNIDNRLITSPKWQVSQITANVPPDAEQISFGLLLIGEGHAFIDGLSFETLDPLPTRPGNNRVATARSAGVIVNRQPQPFPNADFEMGKPGVPPPAWTVIPSDKEKAYVAKIINKNPRYGKQCALLYRNPKSRSKAGYGVLMQTFDATAFRGKKVRVRAAVRVEGATPDDHAQLWMRVDGSKGAGEVAYNTRNRPIKSREWRYYEVLTTVDPDATQINLGVILIRDGRAYLDDVTISVVDDPGKAKSG